MDKSKTYTSEQGGVTMEDFAYGFNISVHYPKNTSELEKRVAQAHANAVIDKLKKMTCSAQQKKDLIDAICT